MHKKLLFTSVSTITLGITSQTFAENVATSSELITAIQNGGNVNITQDITLKSDSRIGTAGANLNIEGNGHTIISNSSVINLQITTNQNFSAKNLTFKDFYPDINWSDSNGVLNNQGNINTLKNVTFENNRQHSAYRHTPQGSAIYNMGKINTIDGAKFLNNTVSYGSGNGASGGAIYNTGTITNITNTAFEENYARNGRGGAIYNYGTIGNITGDFTGNYAKSESSYTQGGAIYNNGTINNIINSSFIGNYVEGNADSKGGAIYSENDLKITADNGTSEFTGNYALADGIKTPNAIYMDIYNSKRPTLTLNSINDGQIIFDDEIDGTEGYKILITGDESGTINFNNNIRNAIITHENVTTNLSDVAFITDNNSLTVNSGKFNITQFGVNDVLTANAITINGGVLNIASAAVDLQAENKMGTIDGDKLTVTGGSINIDQMLISQDGNEGETRAQFITGTNIPQVDISVVETVAPIYKYSVTYDAARGEFVFMRGDKIVPDPIPSTPIRPITPSYKAFNPGVFSGDVLAMSSLNTQNAAVDQVLTQATVLDTSRGRVWATPYYSDDTIGYSGFYDVDSTNYGLVAGVDSKAYGDQWKHVYTVFGAYNDGANKYQGVKVDAKSWMLGLKASVYNGSFYGDALINYAWHDGKAKTAFGKDNIDTTGYGAAIKAGYKHRFEKVEIDTSAMLNWQNIQSNDFKSKSGVKISTDDYSRLSLTPQVKIGYNAEPIRPYVLMRYNFILDEDGSSTLNHQLDIPSFDSKDYVEYGLGLETNTITRHNAYTHILRYDSTHSGWSFTAGYRYNF